MMKRHKSRWSVAAIFLVLLLSACGKSSTDSTPTPSSSNDTLVSTPIPTTGCGKTAPVAQGQTANLTLTSGGIQRSYLLHVPVGYDSRTKTPLVLSIHGYRWDAEKQESHFGQDAQADQQHFLVVYPQGTNNSRGEPGWATYGKTDPTVNDVLFFSDLLTSLQQQVCVDPQRIYAMGVSNGGGMTNLLACQMSERIAAFVLVAAAIYPIPGGCHPTRPLPYLEFHGTSDPVVHYDGGKVLGFAPIMQTMQDWAARDGCSSPPTIFFQQADTTGFKWNNCQAGVVVEHYRIEGGGHTWPGMQPPPPPDAQLGATTQTVSATALSWEFFQDYHLP